MAHLAARLQPGFSLQQQRRAWPSCKHQRGKNIRASWGSGASSNTGTERWWSSTSQDSSSSKPQEEQQAQDSSGGDRCLTGGLVTLANTSMSGMCSMAALLFPQLPVKGVDYEDIAVSLVKALHSNTDAPSTWARPGLLAPAWLLRGLMAAMFNLAHASSGVAAALIPSQQLLMVSGVSQGLMYATCLLLMMPLGAGLRSLAAQLLALAQRNKLQLPSIKLPFSLPSFSDNTYLALKLAGVLAWPCISVAAVLQPSAMAHNSFTANFTVAALQVGVCTLLLALLLSVAVAAGRFAAQLGRRTATTDAVLGFGFQVGGLCAAAGLLNVAQIGLGLASGLLGPLQLVVPAVSTLILARVVWSVWRLHRIGDATPSIWLQLLTLTPGLQLPASKSSS
ncbi:hypothetical protein OEZ85_007228 [Tetradesmus obliquus]|uniref:Uncharacterized protein n=1 Tax=Tetradesmus obliquus TaxID=3088 RepID=A0ABY8U147_TETOB|nr:hypothetical protein OEZ85_007228 [Tetradesmus obliquus]